ncbi:MAG: helix-turn-helix domain-containing protein [Pseudomonadota bacterium]
MSYTTYTYDKPNRTNQYAQLIDDTRQRTSYYHMSTIELNTICLDTTLSATERFLLIDMLRRCSSHENQSVKVHVKRLATELGLSEDTLAKCYNNLEEMGYITRTTRRWDNSTEFHYCVPADLEEAFKNEPSRKGREDYVCATPVLTSAAPTPPAAQKKRKPTKVAAEVIQKPETTPNIAILRQSPHTLIAEEVAYLSMPNSDISHWPQRPDLPIPEVVGPFLDLRQAPLSLPKLLLNPPIPAYLSNTLSLEAVIDVKEYDGTEPSTVVRQAYLPLGTILGRVYAFQYRTAALCWTMEDEKITASSVNLLSDYTSEEVAEFELSSIWYWAQVDAAAETAAASTTSVPSIATANQTLAIPLLNDTEDTCTPHKRHSRNYVRPLPAGTLPVGEALHHLIRIELSDMLEAGLIHNHCRQKHFSTLVEEVLYYLNQPYKAGPSDQVAADAREARWATIQRLLQSGRWSAPKELVKQQNADRQTWPLPLRIIR